MITSYIKFNESLNKEYGGLYVTPIILDERYVQFLDLYSDDIQQVISELCDYINEKYKNYLVVKMTKRIQPGIITKDESDIEEIANDIYEFLNLNGMKNRVVYGKGTVSHFENDIHRCDTGQGTKGSLLVSIGRYTDELKGKTGIFKAK